MWDIKWCTSWFLHFFSTKAWSGLKFANMKGQGGLILMRTPIFSRTSLCLLSNSGNRWLSPHVCMRFVRIGLNTCHLIPSARCRDVSLKLTSGLQNSWWQRARCVWRRPLMHADHRRTDSSLISHITNDAFWGKTPLVESCAVCICTWRPVNRRCCRGANEIKSRTRRAILLRVYCVNCNGRVSWVLFGLRGQISAWTHLLTFGTHLKQHSIHLYRVYDSSRRFIKVIFLY